MDARASSNELFNLTRKKKCLLQVVGSDSREGRGGGRGEKGGEEREGGGEESLTDSTESKLTAEQYPQNRHIHL